MPAAIPVVCVAPCCLVTWPRQDDEVLFSYTSHPAVAKYVEAIIGEDFKSVHTMLINKPPEGVRSGEEQQKFAGSSRHPPHQDLWYFPFRPVSFCIGTWRAVCMRPPAQRLVCQRLLFLIPFVFSHFLPVCRFLPVLSTPEGAQDRCKLDGHAKDRP